MRTKKGFNLRSVCGEYIIVAEGEENIDFSNVISMNESSALLWKSLQQRESFTVDDMAALLISEYNIDRTTAFGDSSTLAAQWAESGIIEGDDKQKTNRNLKTKRKQEAFLNDCSNELPYYTSIPHNHLCLLDLLPHVSIIFKEP